MKRRAQTDAFDEASGCKVSSQSVHIHCGIRTADQRLTVREVQLPRCTAPPRNMNNPFLIDESPLINPPRV